MLPKTNRLGEQGVKKILGRRGVRSPSLLFIPGTKERFAVTVSKKIFPKAVDRNLIRRRIYEVLRTEKLTCGGLIRVTSPLIAKLSPKALVVEIRKVVNTEASC